MIKHSIILVPFPFDDFSTLKVRPALCLTNEIGHHNHVIIAFISSNTTGKILDSDLLIYVNSENWVGTGLITDSVIRLHKIVTIPKSVIVRRLGRINKSVEQVIYTKLKHLFEYDAI